MNQIPPKPKGASKEVVRILRSNAAESIVRHRKRMAEDIREAMKAGGFTPKSSLAYLLGYLENSTVQKVLKEQSWSCRNPSLPPRSEGSQVTSNG